MKRPRPDIYIYIYILMGVVVVVVVVVVVLLLLSGSTVLYWPWAYGLEYSLYSRYKLVLQLEYISNSDIQKLQVQYAALTLLQRQNRRRQARSPFGARSEPVRCVLYVDCVLHVDGYLCTVLDGSIGGSQASLSLLTSDGAASTHTCSTRGTSCVGVVGWDPRSVEEPLLPLPSPPLPSTVMESRSENSCTAKTVGGR